MANYSIYELLKVNVYRLSEGRWYPAITISRRYYKNTKHFQIKSKGVLPAINAALDFYFNDVLKGAEKVTYEKLKELAKNDVVEGFFSDTLAVTIKSKIDSRKPTFCSEHLRNGKPKFISQSRPTTYQGYNALVLNIPKGTRITKYVHSVFEYIKTTAIYSAKVFDEQYDGKVVDEVLLMHFWYMKSEWYINFSEAKVFDGDDADTELAKLDVNNFRNLVESALKQLHSKVTLNELFTM
ncbi:hypothetical protein [Photobacterium leiognathi]|uniref:hypothetical protein n=1 Tax=Photobacterium leiognathi TaxID=553611 RepID=UPI00273A5618|nr:hypothetical protein [Photobacterium leiognathi]